MKIETLTYTNKSGWSSSLPDLDSSNTLILMFCDPEFISNPKPIRELKFKYPQSKIIGCSTAGSVSGASIIDKCISVAIVKFEKTHLKAIKQSIQSAEQSHQAGLEIIEQLKSNDLHAIFILSDGLNINGSELANGLSKKLDEKVIITGGLAADGSDFKKTWTIYGDEIESNQIIAIGLYGSSIQVGHGCRGGWDVFGAERKITRSHNNILYELDGQPALALYKQYLGEMAQGLPANGLLFPLAIWQRETPEFKVVRTILSVDEKEQSLTFAGDMPIGYSAQLMRSKFDDLITSAADASLSALSVLHKDNTTLENPLLSIAISCVGRRLILGERTEEETESVLEKLPHHTKQIGFYSYGELSPQGFRNCDLHNQTMTLTTFYEK